MWNRVRLFERGKYNRKPNPRFQAVIHRPNLYFSKIRKRKLKVQFPLDQEKIQPLETELNSPYGRAD